MNRPRSGLSIPAVTGRPHPRNRHSERYDFAKLQKDCPELTPFIISHPCGGDTINFSDPAAVKTLNRALLKSQYGLTHWDIPDGYLCPPIPSRADYIHHLADLLSEANPEYIPRGPEVRIVDIGVGANCVYPIIGSAEYGWSFVGTDIDPISIRWARNLISTNRTLHRKIECRQQRSPLQHFTGVIEETDFFHASMCNPPFHASAQEAAAGTLRKIRNLGGKAKDGLALNFGGKSTELWCVGGESGFVRRMIAQSAQHAKKFLWFTSLVSKRGSLPSILQALRAVQAVDVRTIAMAQGQKQSRIVAWTFLTPNERSEWRLQCQHRGSDRSS